ncbi:MAG: hypothetical protein MRERV_46c001 [Mycoplasmataceae bacterium RV_VA103A]|nr:MAG: hypothetical protein MRERV_46c001 [Mycoplasmataceae bacterium RV_VA103A]
MPLNSDKFLLLIRRIKNICWVMGFSYKMVVE